MFLLACVAVLTGLSTGVQAYCPCSPDDRSNHNRFCDADFVILALIDQKTSVGNQYIYDVTLKSSGGCMDVAMPQFFKKRRNPPHGNANGNPHTGNPPHGNANGNPHSGNPPHGYANGKSPHGNLRQRRSNSQGNPSRVRGEVHSSSKSKPMSNQGVGSPKYFVKKSDSRPVVKLLGIKSLTSDLLVADDEQVDKTKIYTSSSPDCGVSLITGAKYILSGSITASGEMTIHDCTSVVIECKKKDKLTKEQEVKFSFSYNTSCSHGCREMTFQYADDLMLAQQDSSLSKDCKAVYSEYMCYDQASTCTYNSVEDTCFWSTLDPDSAIEGCGWTNDLPYP